MDEVTNMQGIAAVLVVLAMVVVPLGVATSASGLEHDADRDLTPVLVTESAREGIAGGLVGVRAGETLLGVRYGTSDHPGNLEIFAKYKRYLGGADIVNGQGEVLRTRGIPVYTLLAQSLDRFIEFEDANRDGLLNFHAVDRNGTPTDVPAKALLLHAAWTVEGLSDETVDGITHVNFTLAARDLLYSDIFDGTRRHGTPQDGVLDRVAFTFHLQVGVVNRSLEVPWYRVTVSGGNERGIERVEFLERRDVSGRAVEMGAKYDHEIAGWDFAGAQNLLALETHVLFGNHFPAYVVEFIHMAYYDDHAESDQGARVHDRDSPEEPEHPELYTRDRIYFADDWARVGHVQWVSNVTVDGRADTMSFQIQGGTRFVAERHGAWFTGFGIRGAYIYPNGQDIVHDPAMYAESVLPAFSVGVNLTPMTILAAQLAVVAMAVGPALYLRAKARRRR